MSNTNVAAAIAADKVTTEAATPGRWVHEHADYGDEWWFGGTQNGGEEHVRTATRMPWIVTDADNAADMAFIAAARTRWPVYIAAIEAVQAAIDSEDGWAVATNSMEGDELVAALRRALAVLAPSTEETK